MWKLVLATVTGVALSPFMLPKFRTLFVLTYKYKKNPVVAYATCIKILYKFATARVNACVNARVTPKRFIRGRRASFDDYDDE